MQNTRQRWAFLPITKQYTEVHKLSEDQREICEGKLIVCECALKGMKNNKSPGSDGVLQTLLTWY